MAAISRRVESAMVVAAIGHMLRAVIAELDKAAFVWPAQRRRNRHGIITHRMIVKAVGGFHLAARNEQDCQEPDGFHGAKRVCHAGSTFCIRSL